MKLPVLGLIAIWTLLFLNTGCSTYKTASYQSAPYRSGASTGTGVYHSAYQGPFQLQLPVSKYRFVRGFKRVPGRRPHKGVDLDGHTGDAILAAHRGVVVYAGSSFSGYGKMVLIEFDGEWATLYAHLNRFRVRTGDIVEAGDRIGDMGRTGRASGSHLHFELIKNKQPIDPMPYLRRDPLLSKN